MQALLQAVDEWGGQREYVERQCEHGGWNAQCVEAYVEGLRHATLQLDPAAKRREGVSKRLHELCEGLTKRQRALAGVHETEDWKKINAELKQRQREAHGGREPSPEPRPPPRRVVLEPIEPSAPASPAPKPKRAQRHKNPGKLPSGFALGSVC